MDSMDEIVTAIENNLLEIEQLYRLISEITKENKTLKNITSATCPLCDADMAYRLNTHTHIWVCGECPAILFEYYHHEDLEGLKDELCIEEAADGE